MKLYDISQEVFSCQVYPGDPRPEKKTLCAMDAGDLYNLTAFSMCAHNGTHVDAPAHFLAEGQTVEQLELEVFVGKCYLARREGQLGEREAAEILREAAGIPRILIAGKAVVAESAAAVFAGSGICLLGCEGQSVGPEEAPMRVHQWLLGSRVALLEGIVLTGIPQGQYFLSAAPLNLAGAEGSPCRAYLMELLL